MVTSRERVLRALNFQPTDRLPKDLGGMGSTGISAFAYPRLVAALGLPPRRPKVYDTSQMLALPDVDVMDALGTDVVTIQDGPTNAFDQPEDWHPYDFNGRLPALVRFPQNFKTLPDGTLTQPGSRMPPSSTVFDEEHGGQPLILSGDLPKYDLKQYRRDVQAGALTEEAIRAIAGYCRRARQSTDRAIMFSHGSINPPISIHAHGGLAVFPILCITEPDYVAELEKP